MWFSPTPASRKVTAESSAAAYGAPRVQLCDFSEELSENKGQARGDDAAAEKNGHASWKRAAWGVTLKKAMAGLQEPGESRVRDKEDAKGGGIGVVVARKANEMEMAAYSSLASSSSKKSYSVADFPHPNRSSSSPGDEQLRRCNSIGSSLIRE